MHFRETFLTSIRALLANKLRSFLAVLGIVIGVSAVIILVSLGTGLQTYITGQISALGSNLLYVIPGNLSGDRGPGGAIVNRLTFELADELEKKLESIAKVGAAVQKTAAIKHTNKTSNNASVIGAPANYPNLLLNTKIARGSFFNKAQASTGRKVAIIGESTSKNLFGDTNPIGQKITIGKVSYTVIGVLEPMGSVFGIDQDNTAIVPLSAAKNQFGIENPTTIYISANNPDLVEKAKTIAKEIVGKKIDEEDFTVMSSEDSLSIIQNVTGALSLALAGIAAISLVVGGIGIMNIMLVSVTERIREIGLRKALGAQPKDILYQFLIEAAVLSIMGGLIGVIVGFIGSLGINLIFTTTVTWWSVAIALGVSTAVGLIFGVAPAVQASKLDPIVALKYE